MNMENKIINLISNQLSVSPEKQLTFRLMGTKMPRT